MLLSNMSKLDAVARQVLALRVPFTIVTSEPSPAPAPAPEGQDEEREEGPAAKMAKLETTTEEIAALDLLLEVFLKGEGKQYNANANYDFLASVFANVSLVRAHSSGDLSLSLSLCRPLSTLTPPRDPTRPGSGMLAAPARPRLPPLDARPHHRAALGQAHLVHRAPVDDPARWRRFNHQVRLPARLSLSSSRLPASARRV